MENQPTNSAPQPARAPEYVKLPADDYRTMVQAAYEPHIPPTAGQRVGQTAQTSASLAAFGLLVAGCGWAGVKALNFIEDKRLARELRKKEIEHRMVQENKASSTQPPA